MPVKCIWDPRWLRLLSILRRGFCCFLTFCLFLLPLWESVIVLRFVVRYFVQSSIAIILMGKSGTSFVDLLCFRSVLCLLCLCVRLFICALWSPAWKGLTSWLSFVVSNCEFVTFPFVSGVGCGTWLYPLLIFAPLLSLHNLSSWCLVMVEWLLLSMPWGCLRFVIVLFPDHTH